MLHKQGASAAQVKEAKEFAKQYQTAQERITTLKLQKEELEKKMASLNNIVNTSSNPAEKEQARSKYAELKTMWARIQGELDTQNLF